jgi:hypothetical protein
MQYKSMTGKVERIASTSGHILMIGEDYVDVPEHMEGDARAAGCVSKDMFEKIKGGNVPPPEPMGHEERMEVIVDKIKEMAASNDPNDFTARGKPNLKVLAGKCGFRPDKEEFESAWLVIQKELSEGE